MQNQAKLALVVAVGLWLGGCAEEKKTVADDDRREVFRSAELSGDLASPTDASRIDPRKTCTQGVTLKNGEQVLEISKDSCPADPSQLVKRELVIVRLKISPSPVLAPGTGHELIFRGKAVGLAHDRTITRGPRVIQRRWVVSRLCQLGPTTAPSFRTVCRATVTRGSLERVELIP